MHPGDIADHRILARAFDLLRAATDEPGHLVDIPCGTGALGTRALECGWTVTPCDLEPERWAGPADVAAVRVDLNEPLPLADGMADAVVCSEGIEHVENPWLVLREFRRILRDGGQLVLSLPNTIDLRQRFRMLRRGYWGHYLPKVPPHINAMGTFVLCHALIRTGFAVREVTSPSTYGGLPMRLLSRLFRYGPASGLPKEVREALSSHDVLCGRTAIVRATAEVGEGRANESGGGSAGG